MTSSEETKAAELFSEAEKAYEIFKHAGENNALKVIIDNDLS